MFYDFGGYKNKYGVIIQIHYFSDGKSTKEIRLINVRFLEDNIEQQTPKSSIKRKKGRLFAKWKDGKYYEAVIIESGGKLNKQWLTINSRHVDI